MSRSSGKQAYLLHCNSVLAEGKINIEMISQGSSEINVSCVIAARDSLKALRMVHGLLELPVEESSSASDQS